MFSLAEWTAIDQCYFLTAILYQQLWQNVYSQNVTNNDFNEPIHA